MDDTVVYAPLRRRMALLGQFGSSNETVYADTFLVAEVNRWTALHAYRQAYSTNEDFIWFDQWRMRHASEFRRLVVDPEALGQTANPSRF